MSDQKTSPTMTADDTGAALAGFTLVLSEAIQSGSIESAEQFLEAMASGLRDLVSGMQRHGDTGTPAAEAMLQAAAMLEASAPK